MLYHAVILNNFIGDKQCCYPKRHDYQCVIL